MASRFFDLDREFLIRKRNVELLIQELAEFISCVSRGLITCQEFEALKSFSVDRLFAGTNDVLSEEQFMDRAAGNHRLVCCYEVLDMIFGRVVDQMGHDLEKEHGIHRTIFGRSLQETTLGHYKDNFGKALSFCC